MECVELWNLMTRLWDGCVYFKTSHGISDDSISGHNFEIPLLPSATYPEVRCVSLPNVRKTAVYKYIQINTAVFFNFPQLNKMAVFWEMSSQCKLVLWGTERNFLWTRLRRQFPDEILLLASEREKEVVGRMKASAGRCIQ